MSSSLSPIWGGGGLKGVSPFRTAVSMWGQTTLILSRLSRKRESGPNDEQGAVLVPLLVTCKDGNGTSPKPERRARRTAAVSRLKRGSVTPSSRRAPKKIKQRSRAKRAHILLRHAHALDSLWASEGGREKVDDIKWRFTATATVFV